MRLHLCRDVGLRPLALRTTVLSLTMASLAGAADPGPRFYHQITSRHKGSLIFSLTQFIMLPKKSQIEVFSTQTHFFSRLLQRTK